MKKPTNLRGVQQLAGRLAALSRFIARLGEKALAWGCPRASPRWAYRVRPRYGYLSKALNKEGSIVLLRVQDGVQERRPSLYNKE